MPTSFLLLTGRDVRAVLPLHDLVDTMASVVAAYSAGEAVQPLRTVLEVDESRFYGLMPAYIRARSALGTKLLSFFPANAAVGLPTHMATVALLDPVTGQLLAIMDGSYLTEARTAAVSVVSARYLARPGASRLAILGTGVQARSHLRAIAASFDLTDVRVWNPLPGHSDRFVAEMRDVTRTRLRAAASAEDAVRDADLVVTVTVSPTPVVDTSWVADGAHVMAIGACRPDQRELDPRLVARSRLFVDSRAGALVEAGDVVIGIREGHFGRDHVAGELGELVLERVAGRRSPAEVTVFKSLGMAVEDVAAAELAYRRALEAGVGQRLAL